MKSKWLLVSLAIVGSVGFLAGCGAKDDGPDPVEPSPSEYQKSEEAPNNGRSRGGDDSMGGTKGDG